VSKRREAWLWVPPIHAFGLFYADDDRGAWYAVGGEGRVGTYYYPMLADGSHDPEGFAEVITTYEES
jgi:hypothetical protein